MRSAGRPAIMPMPTWPAASASSTTLRSPPQRLRRKHERVAMLDVDVHHGNGTQGIFFERADVLTVSIHADPASTTIRIFWGHAHERGAGTGLGFNLNLPLPIGTGDEGYLQALGTATRMIEAFAPTALVVALGFDASEHDPLGGPRGHHQRVPAHRSGDRSPQTADGVRAGGRIFVRYSRKQSGRGAGRI